MITFSINWSYIIYEWEVNLNWRWSVILLLRASTSSKDDILIFLAVCKQNLQSSLPELWGKEPIPLFQIKLELCSLKRTSQVNEWES